MGGKRHKGIGYNRAKKKKPVQSVLVDDEVVDQDAPEDTPAASAAAPPEPEAEPSAPCVPLSPQAILEQKEADAFHKLNIMNKRWRKTINTYFNENPGNRWLTKSELARTLERLQHADDEQDAATREYVMCHRESMLNRTVAQLRRRFWRTGRARDSLLLDRALLRLHRFEMRRDIAEMKAMLGPASAEEPPTVEAAPPGGEGKVMELLCARVGLAEAYQWVHLREFRLDDETTPEDSEQRRIKAQEYDRTRLRASVQRHLDAEKTEPSLRFSRNCMLSWGGGCLAREVTAKPVFQILREMGECVCPFPPHPVGTGTCVMCRAKPTDAVGPAAGSSNA